MNFNPIRNFYHPIFLFLFAILLSQCKPPEKGAETTIEANLEKVMATQDQLNDIMNWWPGTFNNDVQIEEAIKQGKDVWRLDDSGENGYLHIQSHYLKINNPSIGAHVLYVEEYRDHDPSATYRQRIYTLSIDSSDLIKVKMWPFKDKKKYIGAWKDISMLDGLTKEEISAYPDFCDLHVTQKGEEYHMVMNDSDCAFGDKVFNYGLKLSKDMFSYRDKITQKDDGKIISTAANFEFHDLNRIN